MIAPKEARLVLKHDDETVEDDVWTFDRKVSRTEAKQIARVAFDEYYDLLNYTSHGNVE